MEPTLIHYEKSEDAFGALSRLGMEPSHEAFIMTNGKHGTTIQLVVNNYRGEVERAFTVAVTNCVNLKIAACHRNVRWFGGKQVSQEAFLDLVSEHYPDYAIWFLFHPECF